MAMRMDTMPPIAYPVGSLVRFRGRDWLVQGLDTTRQPLTWTAVLCPPQLCDRWQTELASKFHIEAVVVRGSSIRQLEDALPSPTTSVFRHYPHLVISTQIGIGCRTWPHCRKRLQPWLG